MHAKHKHFRSLKGLLASLFFGFATQVLADTAELVATVNGEPITRQQLEAEMSRQAFAKMQQGEKPDRYAVLTELINKRILAQQAVKDHIGTDPRVTQALETARIDVLAQAYVELASQIPPPSRKEVEAYYNAHPALFSQRKKYLIQEISFLEALPDEAPLKKAMKKARNVMELVSSYAKPSGYKFTFAAVTVTAEALPLDMVDVFAEKADGEMFIHKKDNGATSVFYMQASKVEPYSFDVAAPMIAQFLTVQARKDWQAARLKDLREGASVVLSP